MNNLEKKPTKGGTPAIENKHIVIKNNDTESKLYWEKEYNVFSLVVTFNNILQKKTTNVVLYKNI